MFVCCRSVAVAVSLVSSVVVAVSLAVVVAVSLAVSVSVQLADGGAPAAAAGGQKRALVRDAAIPTGPRTTPDRRGRFRELLRQRRRRTVARGASTANGLLPRPKRSSFQRRPPLAQGLWVLVVSR